VKLWWGKDGMSGDKVKTKYARYTDGREKTRGFIMYYDLKPIGYIQTYK
jgi:hypothetical protein